MIREFRLVPSGTGQGVSCDANGAFVGAVPLLKQSHGKRRWEPRNCEQLSKRLGADFGLPIDVSSKLGGLRAICNALNDGDIARAQIATVLPAIPDPPPLVKGTRSRKDVIKFIRDLDWSGMIKADWDPDEHPRWPAGAPDSQGGQFAPGAGADGCGKNDALRRRWERAEGRDWPRDANGRRYDVHHIRAKADGGTDDLENIKPMPHDEHIQEHKDNGDFSRWSQRRGKGTSPGTKGPTGAGPNARSRANPVSGPKTIPKSSRTGSPNAATESEVVTEESVTPDETLIEEAPFIIPE